MIKIAPSILAADFARLSDEVRRVKTADMLHLDIMDGHFVPNITFGPDVVKSLRDHSDLVFDVHMMVSDPDSLIKEFAEAGADIITVHAETSVHLYRTLEKIRSLGKRCGLAFNPATPADCLKHVLHLLDMILIMTVEPGYGGQNFIENSLGKIRSVREFCFSAGRPDIDIQVDGGITEHTSKSVVSAGANVLVAGTAVFKAADPAAAICKIRRAAAVGDV